MRMKKVIVLFTALAPALIGLLFALILIKDQAEVNSRIQANNQAQTSTAIGQGKGKPIFASRPNNVILHSVAPALVLLQKLASPCAW